MGWSLNLGSIAGTAVRVHITFLLFLVWIFVASWSQGGPQAAWSGLVFMLLLFLCVLLHEFGHIFTARAFGVNTPDVTLLPIGGVASLERMPEKPGQEIIVALAGPAVNLVIAIVLVIILGVQLDMGLVTQLDEVQSSLTARVAAANVALFVFNLIPAFPMDGGRVLRALLALRLEYTQATQIAANIGQGFAFLFGFIGLFSNPFLVFVALFVWIGAAQEANMVQMRTALGGIPVTRAMQTEFHILSPSDTLGRAVELILSGAQQDFPVTENGRVEGILDRDRLITALSQNGQNALVGDAMRRDVPEIDSHEMVETALMRVQELGVRTIPVTHNGQLVGLITAENITEFIMIRSALKTARKPSIP